MDTSIKAKLHCLFTAPESLINSQWLHFLLPVDRLNWTLPSGPSTCVPRGPIARICARYPSVNLSHVTRANYRCFLLSVCLTADGRIITVGRKTYMDLCPWGQTSANIRASRCSIISTAAAGTAVARCKGVWITLHVPTPRLYPSITLISALI